MIGALERKHRAAPVRKAHDRIDLAASDRVKRVLSLVQALPQLDQEDGGKRARALRPAFHEPRLCTVSSNNFPASGKLPMKRRTAPGRSLTRVGVAMIWFSYALSRAVGLDIDYLKTVGSLDMSLADLGNMAYRLSRSGAGTRDEEPEEIFFPKPGGYGLIKASLRTASLGFLQGTLFPLIRNPQIQSDENVGRILKDFR